MACREVTSSAQPVGGNNGRNLRTVGGIVEQQQHAFVAQLAAIELRKLVPGSAMLDGVDFANCGSPPKTNHAAMAII